MQFSFFPIAGICLTSLETSKEVRLSYLTFPPAAYESPGAPIPPNMPDC